MPIALEQAHTLVEAAHARARELGLRITVAVVDEGGLLQALARMDGAPPLSAQIAEAKAVGAALWHRDGDALAALEQQRASFFAAVGTLTRLPLIPADGSALVRERGAVRGAVGVSGATSEEDRECANAGLGALGLG